MKTSIWDILTGLVLLGILCMIGGFVAIMVNPAMAINPLKPPAPVATIALPTPTETVLGLPPTWTPTPQSEATQSNAEATLRPSSTPQPTATRFLLPTFTPSKVARATLIGGGGSGGSGSGGGNCEVTYQSPADNSVMVHDTAFTMRWTLKNTSDATWRSDSIDLRFMSGDRLNSSKTLYDMPYDVPVNSSIDVTVSMKAPSTAGQYTSNWSLAAGTDPVCRFYVILNVQ